MSFQSMSNLGYATIAVAPSPATIGTSLTVANGLGSLFPSSNFTVTIYPPNTPPLASNAEICLVSSRTGDVFTIVRAQEGTTAKTIATGWQIANTATKIAFTDIQNAMIQFVSAGSTKAGASEVVFSNSNGISFGASGQTITAAVAAGVGGAAISAAGSSQGTGTVVFSNSNGVSFGMNGGTITASVPAAGSINFSAGTQSSNLNSLVFSNTNNVSFGLSNGTLTGSVGAIVVAAGSSIKSDGLVVFSNANSISFGMDGIGNVTASISFPAGSGGVGISAGGASQSTGTVVFSNSNGVSFGLNAGTVTASHNGLSSQSNQAASASNGSFAFQTLGFADANGVTFGTSAGSIVTASVGAGVAAGSLSAGTASVELGQVVFSNSNGISFGLNGSTVTAAHNALTSQSNQAASASNGSFAFQTLGFSNANGVTFGTSAGSIVTASVAAAAVGSINFSAGTQSSNLASLVFSNSNGITFGLSNGTITGSVSSATGGGGATFTQWEPYPLGNNLFSSNYSTEGRLLLLPLSPPCAISFNSIMLIVSASNSFAPNSQTTSLTGSGGITINYGFFSRSNTNSTHADFGKIVTAFSSNYTILLSTSGSSSSKGATFYWQTDSTGGSSSLTASTNSSQMAVNGFSSRILMNIPYATTLSAGQWFFGMHTRHNMTNALILRNIELSWDGGSANRSGLGDTAAGNVNNNNSPLIGLGQYSSTGITSMATSFNLPTDVVNGVNQPRYYYVFK